jgi:hypothetical protein
MIGSAGTTGRRIENRWTKSTLKPKTKVISRIAIQEARVEAVAGRSTMAGERGDVG